MKFGGHQDTEELFLELLKYARPGGQAHTQLTKYLDMTRRNVFIGPRAHQVIKKLIDLYDRVQCDSLRKAGHICRKTGQRCPHSDVFRSCEDYAPLRRGNDQGGDDDY